jgi:hypothetical protein
MRTVRVAALVAACGLAATPWSCTSYGRAGADAPDAQGVDASSRDGFGDGSANTYTDAVLTDGPIAYYRFDETSGTVAHDASGNGNDANIGVGVTWGQQGAIAGDSNTAIHVADGSAGVDVGPRFDFTGTSPFSIEGWVNVEIVDATYRFLFAKDYRAAGIRNSIGILVQSKGLAFERYVDSSGISVSAPPPANKWTYIAATYDGTSLTLFVDGARVQAASDARSQVSKPVSGFIGTNPAGAAAAALVGGIDEVAFYDKALSEDRIFAHFSAAATH